MANDTLVTFDLILSKKTDTSISVSWESHGAVAYYVNVGIDCKTPLPISATAFTATGLTPYTAYILKVIALDTDGNIVWRSNELSVTTIMLGDTTGNGTVTSADALLALQISSGKATPTEIQVTASDVTKDGKVTAVDALLILQFASGKRTNFDVAKTSAPTGLIVVSKTSTTVTLDCSGATAFYKDDVLVSTTFLSNVGWTVHNLSPNTTYSFTATQSGSGGVSDPSAPLSVTTMDGISKPLAPAGLKCTKATPTTITLTWTPTATATGYYVYLAGYKITPIPITESSFTITDSLLQNSSYSVCVSALNSEGESVGNTTITATTSALVSFSIQNVSGAINEEVSVNINTSIASHLNCIDFQVTFDSSVLELVDAPIGSAWAAGLLSFNCPSAGIISCAYINNATSGVMLAGTALAITFKVLSTVSTPVTLTISDCKWGNPSTGLPYEIANGYVNHAAIPTASAPTNVWVSVGDKVGTLRWTVPSYAGTSSIADYKVERKLTTAVDWTVIQHTASTSTSIVISDFINGIAYNLRVSAVNASGAGIVSDYVNIVTGIGNVLLDLDSNDKQNITDTNLEKWRNRLSMAYNCYAELTGAVPYNGVSQTIKSIVADPKGNDYAQMATWAWAWMPYNPIIGWSKGYVKDDHGTPISPQTEIVDELKLVNDNDNWCFGILHELSHSFDKEGWNFQAELFANFKMAYALEQLHGNVEQWGKRTGNQINAYYSECYDKTLASKDGDGNLNGTYSGDFMDSILLNKIKDQVGGWDTFKHVFRNLYGRTTGIATDGGKLNLFLDETSNLSGKDVRAMFSSREKDLIESTFGYDIFTTITRTAPTSLSCSSQNSTSAALVWTGVTGATGYNVYANAVKLNSTPIINTSFTATGLTPNTSYRFTVTAIYAEVESPSSNGCYVTTDPTPVARNAVELTASMDVNTKILTVSQGSVYLGEENSTKIVLGIPSAYADLTWKMEYQPEESVAALTLPLVVNGTSSKIVTVPITLAMTAKVGRLLVSFMAYQSAAEMILKTSTAVIRINETLNAESII